MRKLVKYLKPYRVQCTLGPFCKLMEAVLELILPTIIDHICHDGGQDQFEHCPPSWHI